MNRETKNSVTTYGVDTIRKLIPHRYPFLLIDALKDVVPGESAVGIKNVTINEPFFNGHFPKEPIMPGVLILEAMAQTAAACVMMLLQSEKKTTKGSPVVYFTAIEHVRFRHPVRPGDRLYIATQQKRRRGFYWKFAAEARIEDDVVAAQASFSAQIIYNDD